MTFAEILDEAAQGLDGVNRRVPDAGGVEYLRGDRAFAIVEPGEGAVTIHLSDAVAAAAVRTPDTAPAELGRGWVTLRPMSIDRQSADRARAWFESAWRLAAD